MYLWKKFQDMMVTRRLTLGKNATFNATDISGNIVSAGVGAAESRAAASELTAADSGKTIFLASTTAFATTLPVPAAGLRFKFVVSGIPSSGAHTVVTNGSSNIIKGSLASADLNAASDTSISTGGDTISFVTAKTIAGDFVEVVSDGTSWFAFGNTSVFDGVTITTAS